MALKVWLPLNGNLENKGVSGAVATPAGAITVDNSGKIGKCYKIGTAAGSIVLPANIMQKFTTACSIAFWIKINTWNTNYATVFQHGNAGTAWTSYKFGVMRNNDNKLRLAISDGSNNFYTTSTNDLTLGVWYHIVFTYTTGKCACYVNGSFVRENTTTVVPNFAGATATRIGAYNASGGYQTDIYLNDFRLYDHCLSTKEVKEISQGLILHYKLDNPSITNFSEIGNLIPNYKEMALGSANVSTGTWRVAGTNNMTRSRVQIIDSPAGECYCFQNSGIQTANDGSCYGIDNTTYFEPNTEYRISMFARITAGTEGYAGYNIYNISEELGGSHTKIDKNYRVTPLNSDGSWTYCWYHIKTNSSTIRNIYIGITTGETSVTTQMCLVRIDKWNDGMNGNIIKDSSGYENDGEMVGNSTIKTDSKRYKIDTDFSGTSYIANIINPIRLNNEFTISWWGKINSWKKNWEGFFILQNTTALNSASGTYSIATALHASTANLMTLTIRQGGSSYALDKYKWTYEIGTWAYYACTYKAGVVTYYQNGLSIYTETIPDNSSTDYYYYIGRRVQNSDCEISDFRIYATALSAEDISDLYHTPANIDNLGGIHGFEFIEKTPNLLNPDLREWSKESNVTCVWNEETKYFDINTNRDTSNTSRWGIFQNITVKPNTSYLFAVDMMGIGSAMGISAQDTTATWPSDRNIAGDTKRYYYILTTNATNTVGRVYLNTKPSTNQIAHFKNIYLGEIGEIASIKQNGIFENEDMVEYNENGRITKSGELAGSNFIEK